MDYAYFHQVVDGLDTVLFIVIVVGCAWMWIGNKVDNE